MTERYSAFNLLREAMRGHKGWHPVWRMPDPKPEYDVVLIGGGGHGLATAYYLAKQHGVKRIAVLEKAGWAAATPAVTPLRSGQITSFPKVPRFMICRCASKKVCRAS